MVAEDPNYRLNSKYELIEYDTVKDKKLEEEKITHNDNRYPSEHFSNMTGHYMEQPHQFFSNSLN